MKHDVDTLIMLAKEIGLGDSIDFGYLNFDEDTAYNVVALGLLEKYEQHSEEERETILLASCIHLLVENMVLNLQAMNKARLQ